MLIEINEDNYTVIIIKFKCLKNKTNFRILKRKRKSTVRERNV